MLLRSRPDGRLAAARVSALLPNPSGGWVPPEWAVAAPIEEAEPPLPDAGPEQDSGPERSWSGRGEHALDSARWRLDPGRRGALALVVVALVAALAAGGVALRGRPQEVPAPVLEAAGTPLPGASAPVDAGGEVVVAVSGKVRSPGLVRLPLGSRVDDAVRAAGGPVDGADVGLLNLARRLVDGEQVLVGVEPPAGSAPAAGGAGALLDLNSAGAADLDALPGIGPVLAQRIVDWRTEHGRFASVDQLREVTGIGEAKFQDLQAKVTV